MKREITWFPIAQLDVRIYMRRKICCLRWLVQNNLLNACWKVVGVRCEIAVEWSVGCDLEAGVQNGGVQNIRFFSTKVNLEVFVHEWVSLTCLSYHSSRELMPMLRLSCNTRL
jgi:hypothetical protein